MSSSRRYTLAETEYSKRSDLKKKNRGETIIYYFSDLFLVLGLFCPLTNLYFHRNNYAITRARLDLVCRRRFSTSGFHSSQHARSMWLKNWKSEFITALGLRMIFYLLFVLWSPRVACESQSKSNCYQNARQGTVDIRGRKRRNQQKRKTENGIQNEDATIVCVRALSWIQSEPNASNKR